MNEWYINLQTRFRHGLVIQELLDRLARAGVTIYPYVLMEEVTGTVGARQESRPDVSIDEINAANLQVLEYVGARHLSVEKAALRFSRGHRCFGIWQDGTLAGYAWYRFDHCISIVHNAPLFALASGEAHIYDMYVAKAFRGRELAVALRRHVCRLLQREGIHAVFGLGMYFGHSAQRMYQKLGAVKREVRVLFGIRRRWYRDLRLKSYGAELPIARVHQPVRLP